MVEKSVLIFINLGEHVISRQRSGLKIMPTLFAISTLYKGNTGKWGKWIKVFVPVPVAHPKTYTCKTFHKIWECTLPLVSVKFTWAYVVTIFVTQTMTTTIYVCIYIYIYLIVGQINKTIFLWLWVSRLRDHQTDFNEEYTSLSLNMYIVVS